jgi:NAD(P)-dependent dehydrogenase (short-subunit alcohol dehydrogenase family)
MADAPSYFKYRLLVFGGTGAIGRATIQAALKRDWDVVATTRRSLINDPREKNVKWITFNPFDDAASVLNPHAPYSAVCWAQGANLNDDIRTVDLSKHLELYAANCGYILMTLKGLLDLHLLAKPTRLCVVSSIWQNLARQNKLSYCMTKAALQGLVMSAAADLAEEGHLINAVLPGALDTPMTQKNLRIEQISALCAATKFNRLPTLQDTASIVVYLCSPENTGITGQFIAADLGFSHVRLL